MPRKHLAQPRSPAQRARMPRAAGEVIQASCLTSLTHRQPHAKRFARPCIYSGSPPRLRPHDGCLPCVVSGALFATSLEYDDDPGLYGLVLLEIFRTVCGSCGAPAAHAHALARRAFLSSSLCCRQPPVGGSGAGLCVSLFPLSPSLVCRSIKLCHEQHPDAPAAAERAADRAERIAHVRSRAHARDRVPREGAAVRARCARCAWRVAAILGAVVAWEARRARWCAARRARWRCWRARSRGARFARAMPAGRRVRMGVLAGSWCRVGYC